jgi:Pyridoxamine 5'-phosphate oxidase
VTERTTAQTNLDIYGSDDFTWDVARELLEAGRVEHFWLATTGRDGSPHLAGIGARWFDDQLWFVSGGDTHKSRNLERRPDCAIAAELPELDVTFRGRARRVADQPTVDRLAAHWASTGWPARPGSGAIEADYSAPSAGPPPWSLWVLEARSAVAVGARGAMRWRFA